VKNSDLLAIVNPVVDDSAYVTTGATQRWIVDAYHQVLAERAWSCRLVEKSIALVASQEAYVLLGSGALLTDYDGLVSADLEMTTGGIRAPLFAATPRSYQRVTAHAKGGAASRPLFYTVQGGAPATTAATMLAGGTQNMLLAPVPLATAGNGQNVIVRYLRSVASCELSGANDVPILPAQHHRSIADLALAIGLPLAGRGIEAQGFANLYAQRLKTMVAEDEAITPIRDQPILTLTTMGDMVPMQAKAGPEVFNPQARPGDLDQ